MEKTKSLTTVKQRTVNPACSICEDAGKVTVTLEMPGVRKQDLDIRVEGNELVVEGARPAAPEGANYLLRERIGGDYRKTFTLDESIDHAGVDARLADGILTVVLKVKEASLPRKVAIQ
ncbi:MAG TPA: Hsp20/alpha crystallin family protein [Magnetospirillaceae bacterium]|nr:Hsp20/alpha crystallin family protein [Magnetospirillaceae bacterium]